MRWSTHPLLSRHNTFTFRFLPGVLVGIAVSWWVNDRPRQVWSYQRFAQDAWSSPLSSRKLAPTRANSALNGRAAQAKREAQDGAAEPPAQRQAAATVAEEPEEELKMVLANCISNRNSVYSCERAVYRRAVGTASRMAVDDATEHTADAQQKFGVTGVAVSLSTGAD